MLPIFTPSATSIDIKVPSLTKKNGSYYEFMEKFFVHCLRILIGKGIPQIGPNDRDKLRATDMGD